MDVKITLSFNAKIIEEAKLLAEELGISLSRFTEIIYRKAIEQGPQSIEQYPVSEWVSMIAEDTPSYTKKPQKRKSLKDEFFESRK